MSHKSAKIAALIDGCRGRDLDAHYLGFFECFNHGFYFESHEVLEELWLTHRKKPNDNFYRGLIQLAGAFVHLQKDRLRPAAALFKRAHENLRQYPIVHESLNLADVLPLIDLWLARIEAGQFAVNPLTATTVPRLKLLEVSPAPSRAAGGERAGTRA